MVSEEGGWRDGEKARRMPTWQAGVQTTGPGCLGLMARIHWAWEMSQEPRVKVDKSQLSQTVAIGVSHYLHVGEKWVRDRRSRTGTE